MFMTYAIIYEKILEEENIVSQENTEYQFGWSAKYKGFVMYQVNGDRKNTI